MLSTVAQRIGRYSQVKSHEVAGQKNINSTFAKQSLEPPSFGKLHALFGEKSFKEILKIVKDTDNPYPKNAPYYSAIFEGIIFEGTRNENLMKEYGDVIQSVVSDITNRISHMETKQLIDSIFLLSIRPKSLRISKDLLISMHMRFEAHLKDLITLNSTGQAKEEETITMKDINQICEGLLRLKKNTIIITEILGFASQLLSSRAEQPGFEQVRHDYYEIIWSISEYLSGTIDSMRCQMDAFLRQECAEGRLEHHPAIVRAIIECNYYKNYPLANEKQWLTNYVHGYLRAIRDGSCGLDEACCVLADLVSYAIEIRPPQKLRYLELIKECYAYVKGRIMAISPQEGLQYRDRDTLTVNKFVKMVPGYVGLVFQEQISSICVNRNGVNGFYLQKVIDEIGEIANCHLYPLLEIDQISSETNLQKQTQYLYSKIMGSDDTHASFLLETVLSMITVFKNFDNSIVDYGFTVKLTKFVICLSAVCLRNDFNEVKLLRCLEFAANSLSQLRNPTFHQERISREDTECEQEQRLIEKLYQFYCSLMQRADTAEKSYKPFTAVRMASVIKALGMELKDLEKVMGYLKRQKPSFYIETLARTSIKSHNSEEIEEVLRRVCENWEKTRELELGRIIFLSSKEPEWAEYWLQAGRIEVLRSLASNRKIMSNILDIIRMNNLEINRHSVKALAELILINKLQEARSSGGSGLARAGGEQEHSLKSTICQNCSTLFRFSKMDSLVDCFFRVYKNSQLHFNREPSHVDCLKVLTFCKYVTEEPSIYFINRDNKNATFKFAVLLTKLLSHRAPQRPHFLVGPAYSEHQPVLTGVLDMIRNYAPESKHIYAESAEFFAEYLRYFVRLGALAQALQHDSIATLIFRHFKHDYDRYLNTDDLALFNEMDSPHQILYLLLEIEALLKNHVHHQNPLSNRPYFQNDLKNIVLLIQAAQQKIQRLAAVSPQPGKPYSYNQQLLSRLLTQEFDDFSQYSDQEVLSLLQASVLFSQNHQKARINIETVLQRAVQIDCQNTSSDNDATEAPKTKQYPFQLFKEIMANLCRYLSSRTDQAKQLQLGNRSIVSNRSVREWLVRETLKYAKSIENYEENRFIFATLHSLKVDLLSLWSQEDSPLRPIAPELSVIAKVYTDIEMLSILLFQNIAEFNCRGSRREGASSQNGRVPDTEKLIEFVKILILDIKKFRVVENYGVYFVEEGYEALSTLKGMLLAMLTRAEKGSKVHKDMMVCLKRVQELYLEFSGLREKVMEAEKVNQLQAGDANKTSNTSSHHFLRTNNLLVKRQGASDLEGKLLPLDTFLDQSSGLSRVVDALMELYVRSNSSSANKATMLHKVLGTLSSKAKDYMKWINYKVSEQQQNLIVKSANHSAPDLESLVVNGDLELSTAYTDDQGRELILYRCCSDRATDSKLYFYIFDHNEAFEADSESYRLSGREQLIVDYLELAIRISHAGQENVAIQPIPNSISRKEIKGIIEEFRKGTGKVKLKADYLL